MHIINNRMFRNRTDIETTVFKRLQYVMSRLSLKNKNCKGRFTHIFINPATEGGRYISQMILVAFVLIQIIILKNLSHQSPRRWG